MIAPLTPYAVRGVIWYQGEANAGRAWQYRTLFPALIRDWRRAWGRELPFGFVQLANFQAIEPRPGEHPWAELREAQALALHEPHTGMAVTIDIGEARDIHPRNKRDVGGRLARWALARSYGQKTEYSGPVCVRHTTADGRVRIEFDHAEGLHARHHEPLAGFAIAGADKVWRWAHARIDGTSVVVWHPDVAAPAAVRYAWAANPVCNLVNGAGLPASPFRTDDWPLTTRDAR
jgi:sialate O-acetylesterase